MRYAYRYVVLLIMLYVVGVGLYAADVSQVLAWVPYVRVKPELENVRTILGGTLAETRTTSTTELQALLQGKCVLLIPEQQEKEESDLEALGRAMSGVLLAFLEAGGTIIGMTHSKGAEDILRGAKIWRCNDDYDLRGEELAVASKDDPLAAGVQARFIGPDGTTDFSNLPEGAKVVVHDPRDNAPVTFVWQRGAGTIIMLGFDFFNYTAATEALLRNAVKTAPCGGSPCPACPPCPKGAEMWVALTVADIERLLGELGYAFERKTDSDGDPYWSFRIEGTTVMLLVYAQTAKGSKAYQSIQLAAAWSVTPKPSCTSINQWNADHRGSTAWLDKDGDPVLEANLYLTGGVTWDNLKHFFRLWATSLSSFKRHLTKK